MYQHYHEQITDKPLDAVNFKDKWQVYDKPVSLPKSKYLNAVAQRIGFKESVLSGVENK